ncbi:MAG TPA: class I SAM-dependent methyltransferase [Candidatus Acidoferrales bacterium]|nr:class I SAM-dependent methyltransferase [Candidatus Acidoferrales bacterium]
MTRYNDKQKIAEHYDFVSPYYRSLWGEHLHHGYWIRGDETKEQAQVQLIEHLAQAAGLRPRDRILDVGCGFGGSSIYLARKYNAETIGITISPVQVQMANQAAAAARVNATFLLMDAEVMKFPRPFDVLWSVESISHYRDVAAFFASAAGLLKAGGTLALTDWFKKENLAARQYDKFLRPIERGMLVDLHTMGEYEAMAGSSGLAVIQSENLNRQCAKTWELTTEIIKDRRYWRIAFQKGAALVHFLRAFQAMRAGFRSGNLIYGLLVAKKP